MKRLLGLAFAILLPVGLAAASPEATDADFRAFLATYDKAVARHDVAFLASVLREDYVYTSPGGEATDRAGALEHFRRQQRAPDDPTKSVAHDNVVVRRGADMVVVTHDWTATSAGSAGGPPVIDKGRYTGVFEKRGGGWVVVAEHDSERVHEDAWMLPAVQAASRDYHALRRRLASGRDRAALDAAGDIDALRNTLAGEYTSTEPDGRVLDKAAELARPGSDATTLQRVDVRDQRVRAIDNNAVVETGLLLEAGVRAGRPFEARTRYTTTWAFYDGRWQVTARHASAMP